MEVATTPERRTDRPVALDAKTACEAFQATAGAHRERPAVRTEEDEFSCTWGEYSERVEKIAAGLAAGGTSKGDNVALMLVNRPEFHFADAGVMHLGATPFSIYNTYSAEQIEHLLSDSEARVVITEQAFVDKILTGQESVKSVEEVIVVDGDAPDGTISLDELGDRGEDDFDFEGTWKSVEPDDVLTLIYT